jgi:aminomethyltransferase
VGWDKGDFRGRAALEAERERGVTRRLRGMVLEGRQPPREGYVVRVDGKPAGEVTSGNFSPMLGRGIALGFLPPDLGPGATVEVDLRGKPAPAEIVKLPFLQKKAA